MQAQRVRWFPFLSLTMVTLLLRAAPVAAGDPVATTTTSSTMPGEQLCSIAFELQDLEDFVSGFVDVAVAPNVEIFGCFDTGGFNNVGFSSPAHFGPGFLQVAIEADPPVSGNPIIGGCCANVSGAIDFDSFSGSVMNAMNSMGGESPAEFSVLDIFCDFEPGDSCLGDTTTTSSTSTTTTTTTTTLDSVPVTTTTTTSTSSTTSTSTTSTTTTTTLDSVPVTTTTTTSTSSTTSTTTTTTLDSVPVTTTLPDTTTTTSTSTSTTTTTSLPPTAVCGDPDGSGRITTNDALFVLHASVGSRRCPLAICDVDGDGEITSTDALIVLLRAVGLGPALDCTQSEGL